MLLFVITKIITLETKREIFLTEYTKIANEKYTLVTDKLVYLLSNMNNSVDKYDEMLKLLKEVPAIKAYANNIILELILKYEYEHKPSNLMQWQSSHSKGIIIFTTIIVISVVIYKLVGSDTQLAEITKGGAKISLKNQELTTNTVTKTHEGFSNIADAFKHSYSQLQGVRLTVNEKCLPQIEEIKTLLHETILPLLETLLEMKAHGKTI